MSTRRCDLAPPPSRCARHRRGYFERRVVAGSCIYNGQGCASAAAACCDWEGPLPARAREAAPSRASGDDPGRGCPRAAPCKARSHNYPLPLSGQVFPSSLLAHSRSLSLPRGPASRSGDGAGGSCSCPPFVPFVSSCFCPFAHGNLPSSPAVSLCLPALRCECLPAWQFGYPKLARYGYSQKAGGGRDGMAAVPIRPRGGGGSSRPVTA